ncbi:MAG TPA: carboxymuconolactone decarboxylase family protein [Burkholderiales bacterium]|nr:carboxymuconolactone decarboxylase family protein [Burkholderiales bacterium]
MASELFERGLKTRKEVVGAEHTDRQLKEADAFNLPMQELVTEYCWGWLWNRPGLPRKTRSMLNLAMLAVLNRPNEFKSHVKGALRNGCTKEEISEVLLQAAVYGGVPAGMASFALAREAFREVEAPK